MYKDRVCAEIELVNGGDLYWDRRHRINMDELKRMNVKVRVDNRVLMLCINEHIQLQLQCTVVENRRIQFSNGNIIECNVVAPVEIRFKNRQTTCRAIVLPGDIEPVLGAIPMLDMDVVIHKSQRKL